MTKKVVVITGASSGIGEATAKKLAAAGNKLVLGARRESRLQEIVAAIEQAGGEAVYAVTDVTSSDSVKALAQKAVDTYGRIDVWMSNAGLMPQSELIQGRTEDWDRMIDVNIKGVLYGIAAALPIMRAQKSGQFINTASVAGHAVHPASSVYSATKYAVRAISEGLRQEEAIAGSNVRVTVVSPGMVATELTNHITDAATKDRLEHAWADNAISPEEVADSILFAVNLPENTSMNELVIRPTSQK